MSQMDISLFVVALVHGGRRDVACHHRKLAVHLHDLTEAPWLKIYILPKSSLDVTQTCVLRMQHLVQHQQATLTQITRRKVKPAGTA